MTEVGMQRGYGNRAYSPGSGFQYNFDFRTFNKSRGGRRTASRDSYRRDANLRSPHMLSPEDAIAIAQYTPRQEGFEGLTFGSRSRLPINIGKFLKLDKIARQPMQGTPPPSPTNVLPTPRLAQKIMDRVQSSYRKASQRSVGNQTSDGLRPQTVPTFPTKYDNKEQDTRTWSGSTGKSGVRCVRCAMLPDIQIEGRSLNKVITNQNIQMAKEHCEVLGAILCPDCLRNNAQRNNQKYCAKTTTAADTDVYKLIVIHDKKPYLSMKEVQRKVNNGEISNLVFQPPKLPYVAGDEFISQPFDEFTPPTTPKRVGRRNTLKQIFETIPEASESSPSPPDDYDDTDLESNTSDTSIKVVQYSSGVTEELQKTRIVQPTKKSENESVADEQRTLKQFQSFAMRPYHTPPVGAMRQGMLKPVLPTRPETSPAASSLIPSKDFFFDIKDLAVRIHNNEMQEKKKKRLAKERQVMREFGSQLTVPEVNIETMSVDSNESALSKLDMSYEPPVFFGRNEKNYFI